jgi:tight adherence protein C
VLQMLTVLVFVVVTAVTATLLLWTTGMRRSAVLRLADIPKRQQPPLVSYALVWRELVSRIGRVMPASAKNLPALKRRLIRAGYRHPNAPRYFQGGRTVSIVAFTVVVVMIAGGTAGKVDNLVTALGAGAMLGFIAPNQYLSIAIRRRQRAIEKGLPNTLDLMVVCVEAGLGMDQTTLQVAKELQHAHPEICDEFSVMNLELRAGKRRVDALHNLAERTGVEDVKKLVAVLIQTDRFGTSIAQSLRGHADYLRTMARQRAEERAAKLAVKLVFPIFFCVLPSLFVVTIGPVLTRLIRDLIPMIENM